MANEVRRYRKKPVVIEAQQFDPHADPWPASVLPWPGPDGLTPRDMSWGYIDTLEGRMSVRGGDYIITGIAGEVYPCREDIFIATYDLVEPREEG